MTDIIRIPVFSIGTISQSSKLAELKKKKELTIPQNCYQEYCLLLYDKKNICVSLQYHNILVLLISYEEIIENDENFSDIFNLIQFMQVSKVLCIIIDHYQIKKPQWKLQILQNYISQSQKAFKGNTEYKIFLHEKNEKIGLQHLSFLSNFKNSVNWSENQETLLQVISQNGNQLDVILLKGLLLKFDRLYLENQKAEDQRIQITKIEDKLSYLQENQGKYIRRITVSDEKAVIGKTFLMNKTFELKQLTSHLEIRLFTDSQMKYQEFLTNYKKDQNDYVLLVNKCYDVSKLEFAPMKSYEPQSIFRIYLDTKDRLLVNKYENQKQNDSKAILMNKKTLMIVAFCEITETNYTITVPPQKSVDGQEKEMEQLYIPLNKGDIIGQVERGELIQKGNHITKCRLCMEAEADCLLIPCSHIRYCFTCASEQQECLYCDQKILRKKKLKIKSLSPCQNSYMHKIPQSYQTLWRNSVQTFIDFSKAEQLEIYRSTVKFQDYYCFICKKQKSLFYKICEKEHLLGYCDECVLQTNKCLKDCVEKIQYQGKFKYSFEE